MNLLGHLYQLAWSNPYTEPPEGRPRILAEIFVPAEHPGAGAPGAPREIAEYPRRAGYTMFVSGIEGMPRQLAPEQRGRIRRQRLEKREGKRFPLFAEQFVQEELTAKPQYFAGYNDLDQAVADERERLQRRTRYLVEHPNELLVYEGVEVGSVC